MEKMVRLPVPELPWQQVQIDFITALPSKPKLNENSTERSHRGCIMVVCDVLTKMVHLVGFNHVPTAAETASAYLQNIFKLHGLPLIITTDRGVQFTSKFWKKTMKFLGVDHRLATTNHHHTIGQVERTNAYVEQYLRCFLENFDNESWIKWLYLAEFCYNNSIHASTGQAPFLALYNYQLYANPQTADLVHSLGAAPHIDSFAHNLANLKHILAIQKENYLNAKDKKLANPPVQYQLCDLVWLKKPASFNPLPFYKLQTRRYGPFKITGVYPEQNNFRLDLSSSPFPNMYPIFHVSELEPYYKRSHNPTEFSSTSMDRPSEIIRILSSRKYKGNYQYLVLRRNNSQDWVDADIIDKDKYYDPVLAGYQRFVYDKFCATVNHPE